MATSKIKGITVEIGGDTTGLDKALKGVNQEIRATSSSLKDVERLLKLDPGNTELLRQKYELLNRQIDQTEDKLESLKNAEKSVQDQMKQGKVSEDQYNALKREIIATEASLRDLRSRADATDKAIRGIDEKPIEDVEKAAEDAGEALEDAGKNASNFGDYLKANIVTEGAKALVSTVKDLSNETMEYSRILGTLEVSSKKAGYTADETADVYEKLVAVLGDTQTAATTTANLQALGLSQEELLRVTEQTIGAWAQYGDSIPIDGLAESINETIQAGQVTGTFADVLNWAGTSEDAFNEKLAAAGSAAERANIVMQEMSNQGLQGAYEQWMKLNPEIAEYNLAQDNLNKQMSVLGEKVIPIITEIVTAISNLLTWFNSLDPKMQSLIATIILLTAAIGPATSAIQGMQTAIMFVSANPIVLAVAAAVAALAILIVYGDEVQDMLENLDEFLQGVFAKDWTEVFGPILGTALNTFFANVRNTWNMIKTALNGVIDFIRGVFTGDWDRAWNGVLQIFQAIFAYIGNIAKRPLNAIIGMVNGAISGINTLIRGINNLPGVDIPTIGKIPYLAKGGVLSSGSAIVGEAGPEILTMAGNRAIVQPLTNQTTNNTSLGGITMNIYGAPGQDVRELANIIENELADRIERREAAFA